MTGTSTPSKGMDQLVEDLRDEKIRNSIGPSLALLAPGDWAGFIGWGKAHGYVYSAQDIQAELARVLSPKAIEQLAQNPVLKGWMGDSLTKFIAAGGASH